MSHADSVISSLESPSWGTYETAEIDGGRRHLEARVTHLAGAVLVPLEAHALDGAGPSGLAEADLLGGDGELDLHALLEGGGEVAGARLDLLGLVRGEDGDRLGAEAACGARRVEGGGPVTDDGDRLADADLLALAHLAQQLEAVDGGFGAAQLGGRLLPRAHADEHGVEAGVEQALEGDLEAQGGVVDEADAGLPQGLELAVEHLLGQAELGDAVAQRAARLLVGVVEGDLVAALGEVPGGGEAGRAGADDGHAPAGRHARDQDAVGVVGGGAMQVADRDGIVDLASPAARLAVARADAAEDAGEGQVLADDARGARRVAVLERLHVGRHVDVGRAGVRAGRLAVAVVV